jgi:membrane glycosyltransferase
MSRDDVTVQRWLILGLALSTMAAAGTRLLAIFRVDGIASVETLLLVVFALLFFWIAISFWMACLGAHALWHGFGGGPRREPTTGDAATPLGASRTVLAMPVHNEVSTHVFARLQAMLDSLRAVGAAAHFDFFVLSDSTDADCCAAEFAAWSALRARNPDARIYYRRRDYNTAHKSGNIAEFCRNWGGAYDYMVVLDADSLMTGDTLVHLVRLMDANPRTALIQAAPALIGGESLFARSQQFASWLYGRVYTAALAKLQGPDGNYWGHNAIIRVKPFMENCGLPILSGRPPLGGEIMSHDFVEAALLRRAGWELWLLNDVGGSYEASPPTLIDHLKRDRRWCQGNLQHVRLIFARGLKLPSRLHLAIGVMSYLSSPLWLLSIALFTAHAVQMQYAPPVTYVGKYPVLPWPISHTVAFVSLAIAAMAMLYLPKALAVMVLLRDRRATTAYGGAGRVIAGALIESALSTLLAPITMLSHSWFVFSILIGGNTRWGAQPRSGDGTGFGRALVAFAPHTVIAIAAGALVWSFTPGDFWWYLPLLVGPAIAIPFAWATSKPAWGAATRWLGLFLVPSETAGLPIVDRLDALLAEPVRLPNVVRDRNALLTA